MRQMLDSPVSLADHALTFQIEDDAQKQAAADAVFERRNWRKLGNRDSARRGAAATNERR